MRIIVMLRRILLPLVLVSTTALSGCASDGDDGGVVASFYPLQFVAQRIVGDHAKVTNLTAPGVEPHDLELSPRQAAAVSGATVVFYEKGLQPAVDESVDNDGPEHVVDAADEVDLHHADEHADEHSDEHTDEGAEHEHGDTDPHFWLDPTLLARAADAFTEEMSEADPKHASDFEAGNARLQTDLTALDEEYRAGLRDCTTRTLVTSHDAFGYVGERYDLDVHPIAGLSPDAEPSARHLSELADLIRSDRITTVFSERLASPKLADTLASDLGIRTAVLDPIEGLTSSKGDDDYLSLMRENLRALQKAGGCS
jgi:zinc transport system substrate-binding protein